jgi:Family of unknown function (DUF6221)
MSDELAEFILARIAEVEQMARDASGRRPNDMNPTGDHWQWESTEMDQPINLDNTAEFANQLYVRNPDGGDFTLRSVEEYPTGTVGDLPVFVIDATGDLHPGPARHIAYWDPARVLAKCKADRLVVLALALMALQEPISGARVIALKSLGALAWEHRDHPDYRPEWAPEVL